MLGWLKSSGVAVLLATLLGACAVDDSDETLINHVVVVWMKEEYRSEAEINRLIEGHEMLRQIPGLVSLSVGRVIPSERAVVDSSFDIAAVFQFRSVAAMNEYLDHPDHVEFLRTYPAGRVERTVVYDF